jgi:CMP-N-acetylneuraminic acid synthetase
MKKIAIIPVRSGSKRVEHKNSLLINNKPLYAYSIEVALKSKLFDVVYVNSDDHHILNECTEFGATAYARPASLASDEASLIDVIKEMLIDLDLERECVVSILLATSPLRDVEDLQGAYQKHIQNNKTVVSVTEYETPIYLAQQLDQDSKLVPVFKEEYRKSTKSTNHPKAVKYNESVIISTVKSLLSQSNLIGDRSVPYMMPPERSIMIDYMYQFEMIKLIIEGRDK